MRLSHWPGFLACALFASLLVPALASSVAQEGGSGDLAAMMEKAKRYKQSYVATAVDTMDTAMRRAEGDLDPSGKALLMYGTIDEYLTGEHDKMVKLVWRFLSDDELVLEIHDLPIGEKNTKVVETRYRRRS